MSDYILSIIVYGRGDDPNNRSHWAFAIHSVDSPLCTLYHVNVIGKENLIYQFETRGGQLLASRSAEGHFHLSRIGPDKYTRVVQHISKEPAPRNGKDRCQDWVLNCVILLETEELIEDGTAELIDSLVGKNIDQVEAILKGRWIKNTQRG